MSTITTLLRPEDIVLDVDVSSKGRLLEAIGLHMEREHGMSREWVVTSLSRREQIGSTGIGEGVAIPHARIKDLDRIQIAYLRLKSAIPFDAPDGKPVTDIVVLLVPKQATEEHLTILAEATKLFADSRFRATLHRCESPLAAKQLVDSWMSS